MKSLKLPSPTALALAASLLPFAAMAQSSNEPPVDPPTPVDTAPPTVPADPADPVNPIDPAHPWTPPEASQDPTAGIPPAPIPTGEPMADDSRTDAPLAGPPPAVTGDAVRRGAQDQPVTITSHAPDSVVGEYQVDFDTLDSNGDGYVTRDEARGNEALTAEFHVADSNGDGRLSREDLSGWLR